jgi:hypothetical protein
VAANTGEVIILKNQSSVTIYFTLPRNTTTAYDFTSRTLPGNYDVPSPGFSTITIDALTPVISVFFGDVDPSGQRARIDEYFMSNVAIATAIRVIPAGTLADEILRFNANPFTKSATAYDVVTTIVDPGDNSYQISPANGSATAHISAL